MHETVMRFETDYTLVTDDAGDTIGHMVAVPRTFAGLAADRVVYVGFAHDWDKPDDEQNGYDPLVAEVSEDPASIKAEIERRAREAQAPELEPCPGHVDDDSTLLSGAGIGEATYCDGSCQR